MLFVERVVGNVKGGADVTIGRCTLISGVNGSGKSTIVNIIELALMGFASDIVGRPEVRKGADLITLAPENESLMAEAYTSENDRAYFTIDRNGPGKTKEAVHVGLPGVSVVWPIREAVSALRGSTATARSFVLRHGGLNVAEESILARFGDDTTRTLYTTLAAGVRAQAKDELDTVGVLLAVQEAAKKTETAIKAQAKGAKEVIEQTSATLTVEPSEEEGQEAQGKIDKLTERLAELRVARKAPPPPPPVRDVRAELATRANELAQRLAQKQKTFSELTVQYQQVNAELADPAMSAPVRAIQPEQVEGVIAADGAYAYHAKHPELNQCIVCWQSWGPTPDTLQQQRQAFSGVLSAYQEQEQRIVTQATWERGKRTQIEGVTSRAQGLYQEIATDTAAYQELVQQYEATPPVAAAALAAPPDFTEIDQQIAGVTSELEAARKALTEIQKLRAGWSLVRKAQKQIIEAKREAEAAKNLAEEAGSVADALLAQGRAGFVRRVQSFLPPDDEFDVVLKDGKRSVCMFGFRRNGVLHTALSGAEWARLTIALGAAIIPTEGRVLAILTPEERAFDPDTLGEVMEALKAAPGQVILTSPVEPPTPIEGWTMLRRG